MKRYIVLTILLSVVCATGIQASEYLAFSFAQAVERADEQEVDRILKDPDFDPNHLWGDNKDTLVMYSLRLLAQEQKIWDAIKPRSMRAGAWTALTLGIGYWGVLPAYDALKQWYSALPADRNQWIGQLSSIIKPTVKGTVSCYALSWVLPSTYSGAEAVVVALWHRFNVAHTRLRILNKLLADKRTDKTKKNADGQTIKDLAKALQKDIGSCGFACELLNDAAGIVKQPVTIKKKTA